MKDFKPIEFYSNWCYEDRLDGRRLNDRDLIEVKWGNGNVTENMVSVETSYSPYCDMGRDIQIRDTKAFVEIDQFGTKVPIKLRGSWVTARRVEK